MTATTLTETTPTTRPEIHTGSNRQLHRQGAAAGVAAAVATTGVAAAADAIGVPITIGGESIPLLGFAQLTLVATAIGVVLASVMNRRASQPRHTFVATTLVLTAVSFLPDVLADAAASTKVTLVLTHVVAAAIVIPALASRLAD
jgi:hypothetical protein